MTELKPCPFCGGKVDFNYNIELEPDGIICNNCKTVLRFMRVRHKKNDPYGVVMDRMAEIWNRRINETTVIQNGNNNHCIHNVGTLYL